MSTQRSLLSSVVSWTFLGGLLLGLVLGTAGLITYVRFQMAQSGEETAQKADLDVPEVPAQERMVSYGTVPDDWTLHRASGTDSTTFGELEGVPVVINKWATWCVPCKAEMPTLQALYDSTDQEVRLAVVTEQSRDHVRRYLENADYSMPVYVVDAVPVALRGRGIPRTYVVQPDGQVVYRHVGAADWNTSPVHRLLNRLRLDAS